MIVKFSYAVYIMAMSNTVTQMANTEDNMEKIILSVLDMTISSLKDVVGKEVIEKLVKSCTFRKLLQNAKATQIITMLFKAFETPEQISTIKNLLNSLRENQSWLDNGAAVLCNLISTTTPDKLANVGVVQSSQSYTAATSLAAASSSTSTKDVVINPVVASAKVKVPEVDVKKATSPPKTDDGWERQRRKRKRSEKFHRLLMMEFLLLRRVKLW